MWIVDKYIHWDCICIISDYKDIAALIVFLYFFIYGFFGHLNNIRRFFKKRL